MRGVSTWRSATSRSPSAACLHPTCAHRPRRGRDRRSTRSWWAAPPRARSRAEGGSGDRPRGWVSLPGQARGASVPRVPGVDANHCEGQRAPRCAERERASYPTTPATRVPCTGPSAGCSGGSSARCAACWPRRRGRQTRRYCAREVGAEHERQRDRLPDERLPVVEQREPGAHPAGDVQAVDRRWSRSSRRAASR